MRLWEGHSPVKINPHTCQRLLEAKTKPCAHPDPGKGEVTPTIN